MTQAIPDSSTLSRIIDGSSIPCFVIDSNHRVTYWNTAIESLTGIKRDRIINTSGQWRAFYKEKRPTMADLIVDEATAGEIGSYYPDNYQQSRLIDGAYEAEKFFNDMSSTGSWLRFTASPIKDDSGAIIGAIETLEDITERKIVEDALSESEKSYRALFESAYDAIWVHDMDGLIIAANQALSELCGYHTQEMIGMNVRDFIGGENDLVIAREVKKKLLSGGRIDAPYEMNLPRTWLSLKTIRRHSRTPPETLPAKNGWKKISATTSRRLPAPRRKKENAYPVNSTMTLPNCFFLCPGR